MIFGLIAAALILTGVILFGSARRAGEGFIRTRATILEITRGEARGYIKPIVELVLDDGPRRAVCGDMPRHRLNAECGDTVDVVYKPRGSSGFSALYVDQDGGALRARTASMKIAGAIMLGVGAVFGVLAAVL